MQPFTAYASSNQLRLLLQGAPGSGKSTVAARFPRPAFIDFDVNLGGTIAYLQSQNLPLPVGFDQVDRDETGKPVPMPSRYDRFMRILNTYANDASIDTIVLDSALGLVDIIIAKTMLDHNVQRMSKQEWGTFGNYSKIVLNNLTNSRKHIVMPIHEKRNKTPDGSIAYPVKLPWPGQVGELLGAFFTNVWRCEAVEEGFGPAAKTKFLVRTKPSSQYELKDTIGLPNPWEFSWPTLEQKLNQRNQTAPTTK